MLKVINWKSDFGLFVLCLVVSMIVSLLIGLTGLMAGIVFAGFIGMLLLLLIILNDYKHGFLVLISFSFFMFHLYRVAPLMPYFPVGVVIEILLALLLVAIIIKYVNGYSLSGDLIKNPVTVALGIYCLYSFVLLFNPASKAIIGRVQGLREIIAYWVLFFVAIHVFQKRSFVNFFLHFWLALALIAALYGIYQEFFGLQDWELKWLYSQPDQGSLAIVWGHIRKWSFLSDINAFGLLMAYSAIV